MPHFFCCTPSARSFPISPEETLPTTRSPGKQISDDSAKNVHIDTTSAAKQAYKFQTLLNETLLPGQLPSSPKGAALGRSIDGDKKTGVPLLEDTLYSSTNARSHFSTFGSQGEALQSRPADAPASPCCNRLHIPAHLQSSSSTFSADYRDGEQVMSPASFSDAPARPASARGADGDVAASCDSRPCAAPSLESLWLLLEPPLLRSVSRRSGHRRLCRQHQLQQTNPDRAEAAAAAAPAAAAPPSTAAAGAAGAAATEAARCAAAGPLSRAACAALAHQQLQRELLTAEALPCCPLLLLPHRVYEEPDVVYVVYDSAGEFTDLHSYLLAQQRLPEASCRRVMRQVLQALSVLHERRWVHRNISTETVWIADEQPAQIPTQIQIQAPLAASGSQIQPWPEQLQPLERVEAPPPPPPLPPKPPPSTSESTVSVLHLRSSPAATATPSIVTATAPSYSVVHRNPGSSSTSSTSGPGRRSGGWLQSGVDDPPPPPPPAAPLQRPSCCGSSSSCTSSSSSAACSSSAQQPGRKAHAHQRTHQHLQQSQQSQLHVKLGGLALAVRPAVVDPDTGQEALLRELVGSGYHLAPEAISGAGYGRPADVWGAGVLLYMLLTGRPPFPGLNELEVMTRVLMAASATTRPAASVSSSASASASGPPPSDLRTADRGDGAAPPPRPSTPPPAAAPAAALNPLAQQLPGQPDPIKPKPSDPHRRSSGSGGGGALRSSGGGGGEVGEASGGSRQRASDNAAACMRGSAGGGGGGGGGGGARQQQRDPLRELVLQAVLEACASAACREVLAGMLVSEPERRLTAAELLRLPWFLAGPDEEG